MSGLNKILILAANPKATSRLRLDAEVRDIEAGLRRSRMRDHFEINYRWAVRPRDIQRAMLEVKPQIVHFSGHGQGEEGLVLEDSAGLPKLVDGEALASLFALFSDSLRCVVLNGCYSEVQAQSIARYIDYVVGMRWNISDEAAIEFAVGFYDALGAGKGIEFAFTFARNAISLAGLGEDLTPALFMKKTGKDSRSRSSIEEDHLEQHADRKIKIFISYSHSDEMLLHELTKHLSLLRRQQVIEAWYDRDIAAGREWVGEIDEHLESADLILLLVSPDFLASDYCYDIELRRAMERHEVGEARVIPIILRPVDWAGAPFGKLQALPSDAKPITGWPNRDLAFLNVATGVRLVCEELLRREAARSTARDQILQLDVSYSGRQFQLYEVFKTSGVPTVTFVDPEKFHLLKLALTQPGVGVVIEGPSGIGKTTALKRAIEELGLQERGVAVKNLSARNPQDWSSIESLKLWHKSGIAVVDDFHRLEEGLQHSVVDYLKLLADNEGPQKLVVVGIPSTGKRLVKIAGDIATRVRFFKLGRVSDEIILKMIKRGESALNVVFDRKTEIARAATGSLNMAQFLCYHLAARQGIEATQPATEILAGSLEVAISEVVAGELALKFEDTVRCFASLDDYKETTCIEILKKLTETREGYVSLKHLRDGNPDLAAGIERFMSADYMATLHEECPESKSYILYDRKLSALIVDDPQLSFYLSNVPADRLAALAGKV